MKKFLSLLIVFVIAMAGITCFADDAYPTLTKYCTYSSTPVNYTQYTKCKKTGTTIVLQEKLVKKRFTAFIAKDPSISTLETEIEKIDDKLSHVLTTSRRFSYELKMHMLDQYISDIPDEHQCTDSDGKNFDIKGSVTTENGTSYDYCNGSYVYEYVCDDDEYDVYSYGCPNGCSNGACKTSSISCSDSDGKDYYLKGFVTYNSNTYTDYCSTSSKLVEYFCSNNKKYSSKTTCAYGCYNGKCNSSSNQCSDSDGQSYSIRGTTTYNNTNYTDYCSTSSKLNEYICSNNQLSSVSYTCPNGCTNGICNASFSCSDLDGSNYFLRGVLTYNNTNYTDYCSSSTNVIEYICNTYGMSTYSYGCANGCSNGACNTVSCSDSDNGSNQYSNGYVSYNNNTYNDYCSNSSNLTEYYCSNNNVTSTNYGCQYGCSNGKCNTSNSCTDYDGQDYFTNSYVNYSNTSYHDYCSNSTYLIEYVCQNNQLSSIGYTCPNGCSNNKCTISSCSDTDNGQNYSSYGILTYNNTAYGDFCSNNTLTEFYCTNNGTQYTSNTFNCQYGCANGKCNPTPTCSDTDATNYSLQGTVTYNNTSYADSCTNNNTQVIEYACVNNQVAPTTYTCANGCSNGACRAPCIDSDGGVDYTALGNVIYNNITYQDACLNATQVWEYSCVNNQINTTTYTCGNGCSNGVCISSPGTQ